MLLLKSHWSRKSLPMLHLSAICCVIQVFPSFPTFLQKLSLSSQTNFQHAVNRIFVLEAVRKHFLLRANCDHLAKVKNRKLWLLNFLRSVLFLDFFSSSSLLQYLVSIATKIQLGAGSEKTILQMLRNLVFNLARENARQATPSQLSWADTYLLFPGILYFFS